MKRRLGFHSMVFYFCDVSVCTSQIGSIIMGLLKLGTCSPILVYYYFFFTLLHSHAPYFFLSKILFLWIL